MGQETGQFREALLTAASAWDFAINPSQLDGMVLHFVAMVEANATMNLTRITVPVEAAIKHYADSLAVLLWERQSLSAQTAAAQSHLSGSENCSVLDIGTGAGFPAVPLAVMRPEWRVVALDGTRKKVDFLRAFAQRAECKNLTCEHAHSDHWESRQVFDLVTTRAVASLGQVMKTCRRYVRKSGRIVAYKTLRLSDEEMEGAKQTAGELGLVMEDPFRYELRCGNEVLERALYTVRVA